MPFVSIRMAGTATHEQKAGIVDDVTRSLVARLGKNPAAVQIVIEEVDPANYGAGGQLIADRDAVGTQPQTVQPQTTQPKGDAHAEPGR